MISKELLSEVLGIELYWKDMKIKDNIIIYPHKNGIYNEEKEINIYELAHKCKDYAFDKGYEITESHFTIRIKKLSTGEIRTYEYSEDEQNEGITFKPEYSFKACEWIREQKDKS